MDKEELVITGIGAILSNTDDVNTLWNNLRTGKSQFKKLERYDGAKIGTHVAATVDDFEYTRYIHDLNPHYAEKYGREILIGMSALENARKDARITKDSIEPSRIGIVDSCSRATLNWWYRKSIEQMKNSDDICLSSEDMIPCLNGTTATMYAIYANMQGFVTSLSNACVGGHHAIGLAMNEIRSGNADVMMVCGEEFPIIPPLLSLYTSEKSHCYSKETDPQKAMKPYDISRSGFALGEGAVALCIEKKSRALARGAKIYCELLDHAEVNEAYHATRMDLSGKPNAAMLEKLLKSINKTPDDISYYCAHGTATKYNDLAECRILSHIYKDVSKRPPMGSVKPVYGHLFGGAGVLNVAASALMLYNQTLIPTFVENIDPKCDFDHVSEGERKTEVKNIVSFAHALGSQSAMVALGRNK